jgi:hypothetical protein
MKLRFTGWMVVVSTMVGVSWGLGVSFVESPIFSLNSYATPAVQAPVQAVVQSDRFTVETMSGANAVRISYSPAAARTLRVSLFSMDGRTVCASTIETAPGSRSSVWSIGASRNSSANGLYVLRIRCGDKTSSHRIMMVRKGGAR